jgi:putative SOS response-associated peptidase YedK
MCGRFTNKLTWEDIVRLYRLTLNAPPHNLRPRYNVCPTDTIDTIVVEEGTGERSHQRFGRLPKKKQMKNYQ